MMDTERTIKLKVFIDGIQGRRTTRAGMNGADLTLSRQECANWWYELENAIEDGELVRVVHGKWINFIGDFSTAECSECGELFEVTPEEKPRKEYFDLFKQCYGYCPNCGAKMDGEEENETK